MVNVLKKIGKGIGIFFGCFFGFIALLCVITLVWGGIQAARGTVTEALPQTPADFTPVLRFAVYTDTHNENENVDDAFTTLYDLYDNDETYKGIDAIFGLGDFTSIGNEDNYQQYVETITKYERDETQIVNILGNHEMKNENACEYFRKWFGYEPDQVKEINGFYFICFSGSPSLLEWTFSAKDLKWLHDTLEDVEEKADGKPIFVMHHPHNFGTVYGSTVWGDPQLNTIWAGHPNVISFSGHSHFPADDPRSINQTTYTSVGAGAMARFELDKHGVVGQHPDGYDEAKEVIIVERDKDGRVRLQGYDLNSDVIFYDYFLENFTDASAFPYTYKNLKAHDTAPVFPEGTKATAKKNENGEWVLSFDEAESAYIVHHYDIKITDPDGKKVWKQTFIDDYYIYDDDATADVRLGADTLVPGTEYTAKITAVSAYHLKSEPLTLTFTAAE